MPDDTPEELEEWEKLVLAQMEPKPEPQFDADLVPQVDQSEYVRTEADEAIDRAVDGVDCIDAYRRWCGKKDEYQPGQRRNIMISCPKPDHPDKTPSADINLDVGEDGVWHCHGCQEGGDKYDIAAYHFGFPVPGYKLGSYFPQLKRLMAESLGVVIATSPVTGERWVSVDADGVEADNQEDTLLLEQITPDYISPAQGLDSGDSAETGISDSTNAGTLIQFPQPGDFDEQVIEYPTLEWDAVVRPDGFLSTWMNVTRGDDLPEEFYFYLGLMALGFALGRDVVLDDNPIVRGNLYVCLYGPTGQGKSRSIGALNVLLQKALPYDHTDPHSTGAYMVPSPGSAEALVDAFSRPEPDPTDPKAPPISYGSVRGLIRFDELSTLIGRSNRVGNPMKPMLMEFFDGYAPVEHRTRGSGYVRAEDYFASTVTTTQPKAIRDLLVQTDVDSGFVNRWIFAAGPEKKRIAIARARMDLDKCVDPLQKVRTWASSKRTVGLSMSAATRWGEFFHDELVPLQKRDDSGIYARSDLYLKKIMLLLCADRHMVQADEQIVFDTIHVWEHMKRSYKLLSGEIGMGPYEDVRKALERAMRGFEDRYKKAPTMRDLLRQVAYRKFPGDLVVKVIKAMITLGEVKELSGAVLGTGNRSSTLRYQYVD